MRRRTKIAIAGIAIIILGLVLIEISFSQIPESNSILNQNIDVKLNYPYTSFGVSANYYLNGNRNGKISGTLQSSDCCIDFLIFSTAGWNNWIANGMKASNSSNSPALSVNWSSITTKSGVPAQFSFVPDANTIYMLAFFNNNRSQWNSNSTVVMHVFADIKISYTTAPSSFVIYPGIVILLAGIIVSVWTARYSR
ncbi:MAG: hypothetical protein OK439_07425 [Thaumarchaeota archaeon]|nr:hypothetical protein [Nitrososphaerota archaeon]